MDHADSWRNYVFYYEIADAEKLASHLLKSKKAAYTWEPFPRSYYTEPHGWVLEFFEWMHAYYDANADYFAATAEAVKKDTYDLFLMETAPALAQLEGGGVMSLEGTSDDTRRFYRVQTIQSVDWEGDGLDAYEEGLLGTLDTEADSDGDGLGDALEFTLHLHPNSAQDSDTDGMPDDWEVYHFGTLERDGNGDFDGDGIRDNYECANNLNPSVPDDPFSDPDGDLLTIIQEQAFGTSEQSRDADGDGWSDYYEYFSGTNPHLPDTDGDGTGDFDEDFDADGLVNRVDVLTHQTDPLVPDTDLDGLDDSEELTLGLNPLDHDDAGSDGDGDGLTTAEEVRLGCVYDMPDSDGDGILDGVEVAVGLNPLTQFSDDDLIPDSEEDTDDDGLTNQQELSIGTAMGDWDTDDDGISDGADPDPLSP